MMVAGLPCCRKMTALINRTDFIMTPEQKRLLHPLTPQTSPQKAANLATVVSLVWPFSISRTWLLAYCETFSAADVFLISICFQAQPRRQVGKFRDRPEQPPSGYG